MRYEEILLVKSPVFLTHLLVLFALHGLLLPMQVLLRSTLQPQHLPQSPLRQQSSPPSSTPTQTQGKIPSLLLQVSGLLQEVYTLQSRERLASKAF